VFLHSLWHRQSPRQEQQPYRKPLPSHPPQSIAALGSRRIARLRTLAMAAGIAADIAGRITTRTIVNR
jgi:hypothetical protein